jgi:hypothetical protein
MANLTAAGAPGVRVVHYVPGRLRVRVDGTRDPVDIRQMQPLIEDLPDAEVIRVNAASGSVLIQYTNPAPMAHPRDALATVRRLRHSSRYTR